MEELLLPAVKAQKELFKKLGLRDRVLTLSVTVAIVISLVWRQIGGGGTEIARLLRNEGLLWAPMLIVSQQAISERLRFFPPTLFLQIVLHILPVLHQRWQVRQRPLPPMLAWAQSVF